ncbi:NAD(P)-binding protein [Chloropicon roscoffensis]|uniref:NAD(P)-binding protein n=1 Tax=Chloropicon roscoffensis TaxID=1461544 RepID=A0AAX4PI68_9CHLO
MARVTRAMSSSWRSNILSASEALEVAKTCRRVAVLGIKTAEKRDQPAYHVPEYLQSCGVEVIPVPVYYPDVKEILGKPVYRRIGEIPRPDELDVVDVFRRPKDLHQHLDDLLAAKPKCVWLQSGIAHREFEEELAMNGIKVVSSRCLLLDHQAATRSSNL